MKKPIVLNIWVDIYAIASVLALFFFSNKDAYEFLFALGAKSWILCLGLGSAGSFNQYVGIIAFLWTFLFPVLFIAFYIMAHKKQYVPLCVLIAGDTTISIVWFFYCLIKGNKYILDSAIFDATVSTLYTTVLIICIVGNRDRDTLQKIK